MAKDQEAKTAPPEIDGITQADFEMWRQDAVTKLFLKYMGDYAREVEQFALANWRRGELDLSTDREGRGRVNTLDEVATLTFDHMLIFYSKQDAAETAKEESRPLSDVEREAREEDETANEGPYPL